MSRPLRLTFQGATHHVYARGAAKQPIFLDDRDREHFGDLLEIAAGKYDFRVYALALIPNHFHVVLTTDDGMLSGMMHWWLSAYSTWFNKRHGRSGHVFGSRFKSPLVDRDNYLAEVCSYVHLNPVRAGLAKRPEHYAWSTLKHYQDIRNAPRWLDVKFLLSLFDGRTLAAKAADHLAYVHKRIDKDDPPKLVDDLFYGTESFITKMRRKFGLNAKIGSPAAASSPSVEAAIALVASDFGVQPGTLTRPWARTLRLPRKAAIYLARVHCHATLEELGGAFGRISAAAVLQAARSFKAELSKDASLRRRIEKLSARIS